MQERKMTSQETLMRNTDGSADYKKKHTVHSTRYFEISL
jgi:hypothetical protein